MQRQDSSVAVLTSKSPVLSLYPTPSGPMVISDSGAAVSVVQPHISLYLNNIIPSTLCVAIAADGNSLISPGQGDLSPLSNVLISDNIIRHNCISLCELGYEVKFSK